MDAIRSPKVEQEPAGVGGVYASEDERLVLLVPEGGPADLRPMTVSPAVLRSSALALLGAGARAVRCYERDQGTRKRAGVYKLEPGRMNDRRTHLRWRD